MPSIVPLRQTNHAADSAVETPSEMRRDFFRRRRDPQIPSPESIRGHDSTESPSRRFPPRACFLADLRPQSLANKEQCPPISEKKKLSNTIGQPQGYGPP